MSKNSNLDPYEELANAIVLQAVRDYREANKKLSRGRKNRDAQDTKPLWHSTGQSDAVTIQARVSTTAVGFSFFERNGDLIWEF